MGGFDIFRISRLDDTWDNWSTPENVGTDINSDADEKFFYFDDADDYAYFARMNEDSTYGIIRVERPVFLEKTPMVTVRGNVVNRETSRPVNSVVSMLILPEQNAYSMTIADQTTGSYEIQVPSGNEFKVISEKEGYEPFETTLALENKKSEYVYDLDINMGLAVLLPDKVIAETDETPETPVTPEIWRDQEEAISPDDEISEIAFAFDSDKILPESIPVVDILAAFMTRNSGIIVELAGFTDQIGNERYNYRLSVRRAESVKRYLVEKGIDEIRIKVLGFGEWMPIISGKDKDMNDLRMNRRVEYNFTR
jgi:outer membrane protein OmpA-like peptidoglycan-associated protein